MDFHLYCAFLTLNINTDFSFTNWRRSIRSNQVGGSVGHFDTVTRAENLTNSLQVVRQRLYNVSPASPCLSGVYISLPLTICITLNKDFKHMFYKQDSTQPVALICVGHQRAPPNLFLFTLLSQSQTQWLGPTLCWSRTIHFDFPSWIWIRFYNYGHFYLLYPPHLQDDI